MSSFSLLASPQDNSATGPNSRQGACVAARAAFSRLCQFSVGWWFRVSS